MACTYLYLTLFQFLFLSVKIVQSQILLNKMDAKYVEKWENLRASALSFTQQKNQQQGQKQQQQQQDLQIPVSEFAIETDLKTMIVIVVFDLCME